MTSTHQAKPLISIHHTIKNWSTRKIGSTLLPRGRWVKKDRRRQGYSLGRIVLLIVLCYLLPVAADAQRQHYLSIESDPAFWAGTLPQGLGIDANINARLGKSHSWRVGLLGYSGKWAGAFGKRVVLSGDFTEPNWVTQWSGLGVELQKQIRWRTTRGGLQPGLRVQWNQFVYLQEGAERGRANHAVVCPQVGYQWFPFSQLGLYLLPWAGLQVPFAGTNKINVRGEDKATRKLMPIVTVHLGWEFAW